jgi:hypothetical protein
MLQESLEDYGGDISSYISVIDRYRKMINDGEIRYLSSEQKDELSDSLNHLMSSNVDDYRISRWISIGNQLLSDNFNRYRDNVNDSKEDNDMNDSFSLISDYIHRVDNGELVELSDSDEMALKDAIEKIKSSKIGDNGVKYSWIRQAESLLNGEYFDKKNFNDSRSLDDLVGESLRFVLKNRGLI